MTKSKDKYPANIVALEFTATTLPKLHIIIEEFIQTIPHIKTRITFTNKLVKPRSCYVISSNDYVCKIIHKLIYYSVPYKLVPIRNTTYYYTWFDSNKYYFTKLGVPDESYIAIDKEDYEQYLLYAED